MPGGVSRSGSAIANRAMPIHARNYREAPDAYGDDAGVGTAPAWWGGVIKLDLKRSRPPSSSSPCAFRRAPAEIT